MVIMSGRCHGPGCRNKARVEFFCGEGCQAAWAKHLAGAPASTAETPAWIAASAWTACVTPAARADVRDSVMQEIRSIELAAAAGTVDAAEQVPTFTRAASSVMDDIAALPAPEPIKLTRRQMDTLASTRWPDSPPDASPLWGVGMTVADLSAVPIELVDTVEESTPYQMTQRPRRLELPQTGFGFHNPASLAGLAASLSELADEYPGERRAEFAQVASEEPQVGHDERGWLQRVLDRLRRTR